MTWGIFAFGLSCTLIALLINVYLILRLVSILFQIHDGVVAYLKSILAYQYAIFALCKRVTGDEISFGASVNDEDLIN